MNLTKNFTTAEFKCHCCGDCRVSPGLMAAMQALREKWGKSIKINSGYRCLRHNSAVGGAPDSYHLKGLAADCEILAGVDRYTFVRLAFEVGFRGIGIASGFIHVDIREGPASLWKY